MKPRRGQLAGLLLAVVCGAAAQAQSPPAQPAPTAYVPRPEVLQLFMLGRDTLNQAGRTEDSKARAEKIREAIKYLDQAATKDPKYAPAQYGVAQAYNMLASFGGAEAKEAFPRVKAAAQKALENGDHLAGGHLWLAAAYYQFEWDWAGAEREFRRALELNPREAAAQRFYARFCASLGRFEEALAAVRRSQALESNPSPAYSTLGLVSFWARRYDEAIENYQKILAANPANQTARVYVGLARAQKGQSTDALAELEKGAADRNASAVAALAYGYALAGRREEALKLLKELIEGARKPFTRFPTVVPPYRLAAVYAALAEKDQALEWLEKDYAARGGWMVWLKVDAAFDTLRHDPRFQQLLRRMNFPD
ncbi:MAG: tetratricopeptide repeat protein [Candidatus Acidiferrales bacterium]